MANPLVATMLAVLSPGTGHAYLGLYRRTGGVLLVWLAAMSATTAGMLLLPGIAGSAALVVIPLATVVWMAADANRQARAVQELSGAKSRWGAVLCIFVVIYMAALPAWRANVARRLRITSDNMEPTLLDGDRVITATGVLKGATKRSDVVVFRWAGEERDLYVGRVVAGPGDTVAMHAWVLSVNGERLEEPYAQVSDSTPDPHYWMAWQTRFLLPGVDVSTYEPSSRDWGPLVVPGDSYFVLGDHRNMSLDSRYRGFVHGSAVVGEVRRVYFSQDPVDFSLRHFRTGHRVR